MPAIDLLNQIQGIAAQKRVGQLHSILFRLAKDRCEAEAMVRHFSISEDSSPTVDREILKLRFGNCMDDGILTFLCRKEVPLVVAALALIGLYEFETNHGSSVERASEPVKTRRNPKPVVALLALVISSHKLPSIENLPRKITIEEALELIRIAISYRCFATDELSHLSEDLQLSDDFSLEDEQDILVVLELDDSTECIGVRSFIVLMNRLRESSLIKTIRLVKRAAIGNSSRLQGFHA